MRLTALGLVSSAWRNTCVEDWHAEGRLHDGDMLRISSHMSWRLDQLLWRWRTQMGIAPDAPAHSLDGISFDDFRWLGGRIYQWMVNPSQRLPTGVTLRDVARGNLPQLENDADEALTAFVYQAEDRGAGFAFRRAAAHGGLACRHWWATLPGQSWWTGSSGPLMTPVTPTGATTASSACGYAPSPPRYKTATACAGRCFSSPGPSTSAPPSGSWQQVSATCVTGVADHDGSRVPR